MQSLNTLNVAISVLLSSGLNISAYTGIGILNGYKMPSTAELLENTTTEYGMGIEIWHYEKDDIYAAYIDDLGWFQLM